MSFCTKGTDNVIKNYNHPHLPQSDRISDVSCEKKTHASPLGFQQRSQQCLKLSSDWPRHQSQI